MAQIAEETNVEDLRAYYEARPLTREAAEFVDLWLRALRKLGQVVDNPCPCRYVSLGHALIATVTNAKNQDEMLQGMRDLARKFDF